MNEYLQVFVGGGLVLLAYFVHALYRRQEPTLGDLGVLALMCGGVGTAVLLALNAYRSLRDGTSYFGPNQYITAGLGSVASALAAIIKVVNMFRAQAVPKVSQEDPKAIKAQPDRER